MVDLGLSFGELDAMTLRHFDSLHARRRKVVLAEERAANARAARICAMLANIHRDRGARSEPFTEADFMPVPVDRNRPQPRQQTFEEHVGMLRSFADAIRQARRKPSA